MDLERVDLRALFDRISNWGRWGAEDQAGTLNLIGPEQRLRGIATVSEGIAISCARDMDTVASERVPRPAQWSLLQGGESAPASGVGFATDQLIVAPHGGTHTHVDALSHLFYDGLMYNGRPARLVDREGISTHDMSAMVDGVVSRGVLFDMPTLRGAEYVAVDEPITPEELDEAERRFGVEVQPGDILAVSVGREARVRAEGPDCEMVDGLPVLAGMTAECLVWLRERDVALLVSDTGSDAPTCADRYEPPEMIPIHVGTLVFLGMPLVDSATFERLAPACAELRRWTFALTLAPVRCFGTTGHAINPIALL